MKSIISALPKWLWIVIAIVVAVILIGLISSKFKGFWDKLKFMFEKDGGDYSDGPPGNAREEEIDGMVAEAHAQMHAAIVNPMARDKALEALMELNDSELKYAAKRYKYYSRNESLRDAIDDELMPFSSLDERLLARLSNIKQV